MNKKIKISGIAVKEGISRNKRKYISEELEKFAPTLVGRPILKDHEGITDNVIGKIAESRFNKVDKSVTYTGWVKEDGTGLLEKIKDGRISEVSIGAIAGKMVKENKEDDILIPINMEALELSTTPVPGNKGTSLSMHGERYTEEQLKEIINAYEMESQSSSKIDNVITREDLKMTESTTQKTVTEEVIETINPLQEELDKLKLANESLEKEKLELNESIRQGAIGKYNELCESKGLKAKDLTEASMEMISFATSIVEELPAPEEVKEEEVAEEPAEEEEVKAEEPKAEEKPIAEPQTKEVETEEEAKENFDDYAISDTDVSGGFAFFKYY